MPDYSVGIRHGAADLEAIESAGLVLRTDVGPTVSAGYDELEPQRHLVVVRDVADADAARAHVAQALGWADPAAADLVVRQLPG